MAINAMCVSFLVIVFVCVCMKSFKIIHRSYTEQTFQSTSLFISLFAFHKPCEEMFGNSDMLLLLVFYVRLYTHERNLTVSNISSLV